MPSHQAQHLPTFPMVPNSPPVKPHSKRTGHAQNASHTPRQLSYSCDFTLAVFEGTPCSDPLATPCRHTACLPNQSPEGMPLLRVHHLRLLPSDSSQVHVLTCYPSLKLRRPVWLSYCIFMGRGQNMENAELVKNNSKNKTKNK